MTTTPQVDTPVQGASEQGASEQGASVQGASVQGASVQGASVQGDRMPVAASLGESAQLSLAALAPPLLVWLVLALLPVGRAAELPMLAGTIWGVVLLLRHARATMAMPAVRLALGLFACYWLPSLLSAIDAVEPGKTWSQVAAQLRFAPFALFVAATLRTTAQWRWLLRASALLLLVWVLDGWLQAFTGLSLGGTSASDRLSGIFGAEDLKLGGALAALSPLLLAQAQQRFGPGGLFVAGALLAGVILLAGARAAWLVYLLVLAGLCLRPFAGTRARMIALTLALVGAGALTGVLAYQLSPAFAGRVDRTLQLSAGELPAIDTALAGRLPIWSTASAMALAHPANGVGVRGFRHAYLDHAAADDPWRAQGGAMHPHQLVLEIASETGAIGLAGWLAGALLLVRAWRAAGPAARTHAWPPLLALAAMCFPLNTHYAFHSSWWGLFFWWLLVLAIAALYVRDDDAGAIAQPAPPPPCGTPA